MDERLAFILGVLLHTVDCNGVGRYGRKMQYTGGHYTGI